MYASHKIVSNWPPKSEASLMHHRVIKQALLQTSQALGHNFPGYVTSIPADVQMAWRC